MNKRLIYCLAGSAAILLSGCATPKQQCVSQATQQVRSVESALATARGNIARGYAVHSQRVPFTVMGICHHHAPYSYHVIPYSCPSTHYRVQTTPVAIDVAEERTKVARFQEILPQLRQRADAGVQQCNAQFPD